MGNFISFITNIYYYYYYNIINYLKFSSELIINIDAAFNKYAIQNAQMRFGGGSRVYVCITVEHVQL